MGRLTQADTQTIRLGTTPSGLTSAHFHHPFIYRPDCCPTNSVKTLKASVSRDADTGTNTGRASNTGRGSDVIVLIEAWGFYSRKYGKCFQMISRMNSTAQLRQSTMAVSTE